MITAIFGFVGIVAIVRLWTGGVDCVIENNSSQALRDVTISYSGGHLERARVDPGARWRARLHANNESNVRVTYRLKDDVPRNHVVNCYFGPRYRGQVIVRIAEDGTASSWDDTQFPWPAGALD